MANNPTLLSMPIAENGTKNTIPETQATPGNGFMSQSTGFPAECSLPLGAGGVAPDRADFNGAFNLLSGVAFYAQKGWRFSWDATQDYYKGCIVIDTTDDNAYQALADVSAGGSAPSLDSTKWILYAKQAVTEQQPFIPAFNKRDVITTSGTYTAPVTGWYKITVKGGGGGGQAGSVTGSASAGYGAAGVGGGEGGTSIGWEYFNVGDQVAVVIGAGGAGGNSIGTSGDNGGNTMVTANNHTYIGYGASSNAGGAGDSFYGASGIIGGKGYIPTGTSTTAFAGGAGGGAGGAARFGTAHDGGGGFGGDASIGGGTAFAWTAGGNGAAGFAWFEYFAAY